MEHDIIRDAKLAAALLLLAAPALAGNGALFVKQTPVVQTFSVGYANTVLVTFKNTGTTVWTREAGYRLGSEWFRDNVVWGQARVDLAPGERILPGMSKTFAVPMRPTMVGRFVFCWRLLQEHAEWFGNISAAVPVSVLPDPPGPYIDGGFNAAGTSSFSSGDRLVMSYLFYWYDIDSGGHIDKGESLIDRPVSFTNPRFTWKSVAWFEKELKNMKAAGIDIVLPVYRASPDAGDFWRTDGWKYEAEWSNGGLVNMVQALRNLKAKGFPVPKIGMFYDTTSLAFHPMKPYDLTRWYNWNYFWGTIRDFYSLIPPEFRAEIDGREVVSLYYSWSPDTGARYDYNQATFDMLHRAFSQHFGGKTLYIVAERSWYDKARGDKSYVWGVAYGGPAILDVAAIGPGWDTTWRKGGVKRDREKGAYYARNWAAAINSGRSLVAIETWNELHEGTDIAESREYGTDYIRLTSGWANKWKGLKNDAVCVRQSGPFNLAPGGTTTVSVTMKNTGRTIWSSEAQYRLGSQSPQDNETWGIARAGLERDQDYILPGQEKTFVFNIKAPLQPGDYKFQWGMLQEWFEWFGTPTPPVIIKVRSDASASPGAPVLMNPVARNSAGQGPTLAESTAIRATAVSARSLAPTSVSAGSMTAGSVGPSPISGRRLTPTSTSAGRVRAAAVSPSR